MAAVQVPLLRVPLKESEEVSWLPLKQYIQDVYHTDPEEYMNELRALQRLRQVCARMPRVHFTDCVGV